MLFRVFLNLEIYCVALMRHLFLMSVFYYDIALSALTLFSQLSENHNTEIHTG